MKRWCQGGETAANGDFILYGTESPGDGWREAGSWNEDTGRLETPSGELGTILFEGERKK